MSIKQLLNDFLIKKLKCSKTVLLSSDWGKKKKKKKNSGMKNNCFKLKKKILFWVKYKAYHTSITTIITTACNTFLAMLCIKQELVLISASQKMKEQRQLVSTSYPTRCAVVKKQQPRLDRKMMMMRRRRRRRRSRRKKISSNSSWWFSI